MITNIYRLTMDLDVTVRGSRDPHTFYAAELVRYLEGEREPTIRIMQSRDGMEWTHTGGSWYLSTLLGEDQWSMRVGPADSISIDFGAQWTVERGMLSALRVAERLRDTWEVEA